MIVYAESKAVFRRDVLSNRIEEVVHELYRARLHRSVGRREVESWRNSMQYMDRVLEDPEIADDVRVGIEYTIPQSAKRIDFVLSGRDAAEHDNLVIVELKQWSSMEPTPKDAIVRTVLGGRMVETEHPSYQAWTYAALLEDYNEEVQEGEIGLHPCAYLHNCVSGAVVRSAFYAEHTKRAPAFVRDDALALRDFIKQHVRYGDASDVLYRIENGRIRPSKGLADALVSMLAGNREFLMIDEQKLVYETALALAEESVSNGKRQVLIVEGGPGTGKSVVAMNLLVESTRRDQVARYVSRNAAPRAVYESKLVGHHRKSRISNLFGGSGSFTETPAGTFDVLIVDEAHRLNEKSGLYQNLGENQIKELISAAKFSVFFVDSDQQVTLKDIGDKETIRTWAERLGAASIEMELSSQFRCNGSDGYLAWLDHTLQIRDTAHPTLDGVDYEFGVSDSPTELRDAIVERNVATNRSRLVAGYCWPWASKKDPEAMDIVFEEHDFAMRWNLTDDGSLWIVKPSSIDEVGCIHTCQGLELDYVGVILGEDLVVRDGRLVADVTKRARADRTVFGHKKFARENPEIAPKRFDRIVKNTYRTLMTRGMRGCYVYSVDAETREYFRSAAFRN